jgi:hypothetical protein
MTSYQDFEFAQFFLGVTAQQIDKALVRVQSQWYGLLNGDLWSGLPQNIQAAKIDQMSDLLVAWYLAENFPDSVVNAISNGALPLSSKSVEGVSVTYLPLEDVQGDMKMLMTNQWGQQALQMFQSAPERFLLFPGVT